MISQGLILTLIGMGVVFVFLILLVAVMYILAFVVRTFFPEKEPEPKKERSSNGAEIAAVIAAAAAHQKS